MGANYQTHSAEETMALGKKVAKECENAQIVLLQGQLGAGKTAFTKGFVTGFEISPDMVKSPTYAYYNKYEGARSIFHFDCYRLQEDGKTSLLREIEEILESEPTATVVIEWPSNIDMTDAADIVVRMEHTDDPHTRSITITKYAH